MEVNNVSLTFRILSSALRSTASPKLRLLVPLDHVLLVLLDLTWLKSAHIFNRFDRFNVFSFPLDPASPCQTPKLFGLKLPAQEPSLLVGPGPPNRLVSKASDVQSPDPHPSKLTLLHAPASRGFKIYLFAHYQVQPHVTPTPRQAHVDPPQLTR